MARPSDVGTSGGIPKMLLLISSDGLVSFNWRLQMVEAYLPNIWTYFV
jgi:hypothetical protein